MKFFLTILIITLISCITASCGKTTKGEISSVWSITELENTDFFNVGDSVSIVHYQYNDVLEEVYQQGDTTIRPGMSIDKAEYIIRQNGTYEINFQGNGSYVPPCCGYGVNNVTQKETGKWAFAKKDNINDFKKNDHLIFHTLTQNTSMHKYQVMAPGYTTNDIYENYSKSYQLGERSVTFNIDEVSRRKLVLSATRSNSTPYTIKPQGKYKLTLER